MPHLHWETDRQREKSTLEIEHFTESWKDKTKNGSVEKSEAPFQKSSPPRPAQPRREKEISTSTSGPNTLRQMIRTVSRRQAVMNLYPHPIPDVKNKTTVACANGYHFFERKSTSAKTAKVGVPPNKD